MTYRYSTGIVVPFVQKHIKLLILAITAMFVSSVLAMTLSTQAVAAPNWELDAGSQIDFSCGGGSYVHTLDTVVKGNGGEFSGTGHYNIDSNYTWDIDGTISGDTFNFSILYTGASAGSVYNASNGLVSPDGSAAADVDGNCQTLSMPSGSFSEFSIPESEVDIYGNTVDTSLGENGSEGWWFNRDLSTSTPFEFTESMPSIGNGSLYVKPIGASASDKFIAEDFVFDEMGNVDKFSYDFKIGSGGEEADKVHFYLNVYANFNSSGPTNFYDCRYNVVPSSGSTSSYTTVEFDPSMSYPVSTRGSSPVQPCPSVPNDMGSDAYIRVFAINVGDTSTNDEGLDGYFDNVVYKTTSAQTTYDFELFQPTGNIKKPKENQHVTRTLKLKAIYNDGDEENDDAVQWAVRQGTCAAGTNTVFGNVDGFDDEYKWDGSKFKSKLDIRGVDAGMYCFVFNPTDDPGQNNVRETREFYIDAYAPESKDDCKNGGWQNYVNPSFKNQGACIKYVNGDDDHNHHKHRHHYQEQFKKWIKWLQYMQWGHYNWR